MTRGVREISIAQFDTQRCPFYLSKTLWKLHPTRRQTSTFSARSSVDQSALACALDRFNALEAELNFFSCALQDILRAQSLRGKNIDLKCSKICTLFCWEQKKRSVCSSLAERRSYMQAPSCERWLLFGS